MKIGVALSGGVDSATCLYLLKQQNYDVFGMTLLLVDDCDKQISEVKKICKRFDVKFHILDYREEFKKKIINVFEESIKKHQMIIPCIDCNRYIKLGVMHKFCRDKDAKIATGHYAKIINNNNSFEIHKAKDVLKDQTHFLHGIDRDVLKNTIFPLGDYLKSEVFRLSKKERILDTEQYKESQNVCFFQGKTYEEYVKAILKNEKKGDILHIKTKQKIGSHNGLMKYTIGQRQGIGIAWKEPLYVVNRDFEENILYVGEEKELFSDKLTLKKVNLLLSEDEISSLLEEEKKTQINGNTYFEHNHDNDIDDKNRKTRIIVIECDICTRDKTPIVPAKVIIDYDKKKASVHLKQSARAITSGQSCVFYIKTRMIGGGIIE